MSEEQPATGKVGPPKGIPVEKLGDPPGPPLAQPDGPPPGARSAGTPSPGLATMRGAKTVEDGGIVDTTPDYEPLTDAASEAGVYTIVGGYVDDDGKLHNEVELRAMTGHEEDILGNDSVTLVQRLNTIMAKCCLRIGDIVGEGPIRHAVSTMPTGSRTDLLIYLRVVSHWKSVKDEYLMDIRCPKRRGGCGKAGTHRLSLLDLERFDAEDATKQTYDLELPIGGQKVTWRFMTGEFDHVLDVVSDSKDRMDFLSFGILVRLLSVDDERVDIGVSDLLSRDGKRVKLSKSARKWLKRVKDLPVGDREELRAAFLDEEPGVDTDIEYECEHCGRTFSTVLAVGQPGFFFPQATSTRSRRRRST